MNWQQLKESIDKKEFSGICLLYGSGEYLKDVAIKKAVSLYVPSGLEDINVAKIVDEDIEKINEAINMLPFMAEKRIVIIDSYKKFYATKAQYKSADMIKAEEYFKAMAEKEYEDCCIFFLCRGAVAADNPLLKVFKKKNLAVSYDKITEQDKANLIKEIAESKGAEISLSVINFLINYTGADLLSLENELDKLQNYAQGEIKTSDVEKVCHASTDYNVFNMIKAIDNRKKGEALQILEEMLMAGENIGGIISLIERQYRVYAFIEDIEGEFGNRVDYDILEMRLGVKSFVIKKMYSQGLKIEKGKRQEILKMCGDADYLAKRGRINDAAALEKLVINLIAN
ncbi:MAG: DNA polymerase III subunit delta [Clostridia bacterium]|nr:DNA polymerase III subunit delta [Clostridia bacterium]